MDAIRQATNADVFRLAEIEVFNYRLFFYPIFRTDRYFFSELSVPVLIEEYWREPERIARTLVYDDGVVKGFIRVNGEEIWETGEGIYRWAPGEPTYVDTNDRVAEDYVMLWDHNGWAYNDNRDDPCADYPEFYSGTMGYICEFEAAG